MKPAPVMRDTDGSDHEPAKPYVERLRALEDVREDHEGDWKDIQTYIMPRKGFFDDIKDNGPKKAKDHSRIIDPTGGQSVKYLAAGMLGGMTSPARPWVRLTLRDDKLMEYTPVRQWFHDATKAMLDIFGWSNLYTALYTLYKEVPGFGTGCMLCEEDDESMVRFLNFTCGEYFLAVNHKGIIDSFYRKYTMTARNMIDKFGKDAVSDEVKRAAEQTSGKEKYFDVCHCIQPNKYRDDRKLDKKAMPFESVYWQDKKTDRLLGRSGYREFPVMAPRWDTTSTFTIYGEGPGKDQLGNIKLLQSMARGQVAAMHKELEPPMRIPPGYKDRLSLAAGAQNIDPTLGQMDGRGQGISKLFDFRFDYQGITAKIQDLRNQIAEGFYIDLFRMLVDRPGAQPPTAREIAERHEEKLIMLSPVLERLQSELLNPLIKRVFNIMLRNEALPPPPQEIQGADIKVEYTSILSQAQKLIGLQSIDTFMMFVGQAAGVFPEILDKVDADELVDQYGDSTGIPPKIIRSDDEVAAMRKAKAEQAQAMQQAQTLMAGADTAKTLSETDTGGQNALTDLTQAMTGM